MSPLAVGGMSLYELESMMRSFEKLDKRYMTDEEYEASKDRWRALNLPDVRV